MHETRENLSRERDDLHMKISFGERAFAQGMDKVSGAIARRTLQDIQAMRRRLAEVEAELERRTGIRATAKEETPFPWRDFGGHGDSAEAKP